MESSLLLKELPAQKRKENVEVVLGPSKDEVVAHSISALKACNGECQASCPLSVDIKGVLSLVAKKDFQSARDLLDSQNPFPSICSRMCRAHCEGSCGCAKGFTGVERFLGDNYQPKKSKVKQSKAKVAIVGAGISGLTSAAMLARQGVQVKLFEASDRPGGFLARTTPSFRMQSKIVEKEVSYVTQGLDLSTHSIGGASHPIEDLSQKMDAVIVATGANKPMFLGIEGEHMQQVFTAQDFISAPKKTSKGKTVVIGATSLAIDAARLANHLGDDVTVIFHKDESNMPCDQSIIKHAQQEGVSFMVLTKPVSITGKDKVSSVKCCHMMLAESDIDDTKVSVPIEDSDFELACDKVIIGIGLEPNPTLGRYSSLRTVGKGRVWTNEHLQTSIQNVFAAGEISLGSASVDRTIAHAKLAAENVIKYLKGEIESEEM